MRKGEVEDWKNKTEEDALNTDKTRLPITYNLSLPNEDQLTSKQLQESGFRNGRFERKELGYVRVCSRLRCELVFE